jgi:Tol biopolymer transport system component
MLINMIRRKQWFILKLVLISLGISSIVAPFGVSGRQRTQLPSNRIIFSWNRDGDFDIYLMDADSPTGISQWTDNTAPDLTPVWSPDGMHVALTSQVSGNYEIYVLNMATGESDVVTNNTWDDLYPAWSPDGKQIAFTTNRDSNWDIYVMNANGKNPQRLTNDPSYQGNPVWSPDGTLIAYVEGRDAKRDIMVMNADSSNVQPLTALATSADYSPAWSPDSKQIAFVSNRGGNNDIYVVDATCVASNSCDQLAVDITADNLGDDLDPAWRPDGEQIVFASVRDSATSTDLYMMAVDGTNITQVTATDGDERFPSWWHQP